MFATTLEQRGIKKNRPLIAFFDDKNNTIDIVNEIIVKKTVIFLFNKD